MLLTIIEFLMMFIPTMLLVVTAHRLSNGVWPSFGDIFSFSMLGWVLLVGAIISFLVVGFGFGIAALMIVAFFGLFVYEFEHVEEVAEWISKNS